MTLKILAPHTLRQFQQTFGEYLRSQRQTAKDSVAQRVGKIYQELIFNNICGFLNQCFPICRAILGEVDFNKLSLYFFQRYPTHSPYFSEIPMQFVDFLAKLADDEYDKSEWLDELTLSYQEIMQLIPEYLPEMAHYEWLELYVETLPNQENALILQSNPSYLLNTTAQNAYYSYPVQQINANTGKQLEAKPTCLVVLRDDEKVKFVEINPLTHLFLDFLQNSQTVYDNQTSLIHDFAKSIDYADVAGLIDFTDDLFAMLVNEKILFQQSP